VGWIGWFTVLHCSFVSRWRCVQRSMPQPQDLKLKFPVLIVAWLLRITTLTSALCRRITWSRQTIGHYYIIQANTTAWRHSVVVIKTADSLVDRLKLARRLCFKRPLLLVDVSVWLCLCVGNFDAKYLGNQAIQGFVSNRDPWESAYGTSIGDVIDDVTWLWRHNREVTMFKVVTFGNWEPDQLSVLSVYVHSHCRRTLC